MSWLWRWLLLVATLTTTMALPVPDETDTSTKLLGSSVVTSVSVVMGQEDGASEKPDTRKATESDLPPSTVDMMKPDGFQFYTVDEKGQLITRQMTDSEIQSIIAAGGGPFPIDPQDPQKNGDNAMGEMKVADVVQNVKKVLKDELNKPAMAMGTVPTIPGHANDEWSSILPSILGGEADSAPVTIPEMESIPTKEMVKQNVSAVENPTEAEISLDKMPVPETSEVKPQESESTDADKAKPTEEKTKNDEMVKIEQKPQQENPEEPAKTEQASAQVPQETPERPMIQVPVITADSVQSTMKDPTMEVEKPVYQILNTISAEEVKDKDDLTPEKTKPAEKEPEKTETFAIPEKQSVSGTSPVTEKIEGEVKKPELVEEVPSTTAAPVETVVEMEVSPSSVPSVEGGSDKPEISSSSPSPAITKETEDVKVAPPSLTLEAPIAAEKPVTMEVVPEIKPEEGITAEKKPAVVEEASTTSALQTEGTTSEAATIEEEVSEMVNLMPESISSIVDELISDSSNSLPEDKAKPDTPEASVGDNDSKKPEAPASGNDSTKIEDSDVKPDDSNSKVTPTVISDAQKLVTESEPVFQMLPEMSPDSSVTKPTAETSAPSGIDGKKPEMTEAVSKETVSGDKIEQQTETSAQSETPQTMIPVIEAAASTIEKNDDPEGETTQKTVEKKPETLLTELADSVSSMISQVSEVLPSMVPIPQKTETSEPPIKRVEDGIKSEETSTVVTIPSKEADKPLAPDAELPSKEETIKPEKSEPEVIMVEIKNPEPITISTIVDTPVTTKIDEQVSADPIPEMSETMVKDKIESIEIKTPSDVEKMETPAPEMEKNEQAEAIPVDSEANKLSGPSNDQESAKPEETVVRKPEDPKPEKMEDVAKDEPKIEENIPNAEAPIVRIDITEVKPTDSDVKNDDSTESSVVRIQLTNTVSTVNQMIDSGSEVVPAVEVEDILLPEKTVLEASSPQNVGSSLIAGTQPLDVVEKDTSEDLPQLETAASASSEILEDLEPTTTVNTESDTKTESKPDADKPQPEIEKEKISEVELTQVTVQDKPLVNNQESDKSEVLKTTEAPTESKPEKPAESEIPKDAAEKEAPPVESTIKFDPPVPADEKMESPIKSEDQEEPMQTPEKIIEPVKVIPDEKIEQTETPEAVKIDVEKPAEVPAVQETPTMVPADVVISTTVEVEPTKESPQVIKEEPVKLVEKPEKTDTKLAPESIGSLEKKPEEENPKADDTVTKITEAPIESNEKLVPVELASPIAMQPEAESPVLLPEASTLAPISENKKTEESEVQKETEAPTTVEINSEIQTPESTEKRPEVPDIKSEIMAQVTNSIVPETVKETSDSVVKPEMVKIEDPKSPSTENEPEKKIPIAASPGQADVKESSVPDVPDKDQTSVPLVRIDVSPEKNQTESSMIKIEEIPDSTVDDDKKTEKPEIPASTETNSSGADEPVKKTDEPKKDSAVETSSAQSVEPATSESPSNAPMQTVAEETKVPMPTAKEPEVLVKPTEESIKETVNVVHPKLPEMSGAVEMTPANPIATKIDNKETAKPVIRIDNTPGNAPVKTQEIRIQVNDTAVLVTKQKIPQKSENDEKIVLPTDIPDSVINKFESSSQIPEKIETTNQQPEKTQVLSQEPDKLEGSSQKPEKVEAPIQEPAKIDVPNQTLEKIEVSSQKPDQIKIPSQKPEKIEVSNQKMDKIEAASQKPEKIEVSNQKMDKLEALSQKPEKIEVSSQPTKIQSVQPEKIEVLNQPTKIPIVEQVAPVTSADKTTPKETEEKVKTEIKSEQKKPLVDPYVKLGETKPEQKPMESNTAKLPISSNKKPSNTEPSKDGADKWTLIPQSEQSPVIKQQDKPQAEEPSSTIKNEDVSVPLEAHKSAVSLAESTRNQDEDISNFSKLCNELAFSFWVAANKGLSTARSLALSPFGMTSMLAMVFLGARGPTSGQMNDILKLDDVVTFNPHLVFQNVSDSVNLARGQGIANAAFVRELFADRIKAGRLLPFYKERAQQFYDGHVEEVNFATISDLVRRRTNLLIRRQTGGRIRDFVKGNVMPLRSPLAALSANVFQTDCTGASSEGRDGEMYFAVLPAVRQRKLVPVPATVWRSGVLAGYEPGLDATVVSLGGVGNLVSTIFVLPGQQGAAAPGDSLDHLERRLLNGAFTNGVWDRLMRVLIPRMGLEVQVPKFSHRSIVNATAALKRMGLDDLFSRHADLKGINGIGNDLHLADMLQINLFSTCGDEVITGGRHHVEIYPASPLRGARVEKKAMDIEEYEGLKEEKQAEMDVKKEEMNVEEEEMNVEEAEQTRRRRSLKVGEYLVKRSTSQAVEKQLIEEDRADEERSQRSSTNNKELLQLSKGKQNERPLLKLDRPFLYFVRHNPTGMILHMGRFNPRLMP